MSAASSASARRHCTTCARSNGGLEVSDLRRLRELEDENRRLKKIVADQVLNIEALTSVAEGTSRACSSPRSRAGRGSAHPSTSAAPMPLAGYQPRTVAEAPFACVRIARLRARREALAARYRRYGLPRLLVLLRREGVTDNHKRVGRVYREPPSCTCASVFAASSRWAAVPCHPLWRSPTCAGRGTSSRTAYAAGGVCGS
jgi:hypothetical protein